MAAERQGALLVTGADGFVGRALCPALVAQGYRVRRAVRLPGQPTAPGNATSEGTNSAGAEEAVVGDISGDVRWSPLLEGIHTVIHLAGRAHVMHQSGEDALPLFRQVNVRATRELARSAAAAGVKRLIFISTIKVHGDFSPGRPFRETDPLRPGDAYALSKVEAENALADVNRNTGIEIVTLRPPLVYGPGVKGNFLRLMKLVARRCPLPLASVHNLRSLIFVGNLVDGIIACVESPAAGGNTYLVGDGEDVSTPGLIRLLAAALGVRARLFPFPVTLLELGARALGKGDEVARLGESLQLDAEKIHRQLGWRPRYSLQHGLEETANWYRGATRGTKNQ